MSRTPRKYDFIRTNSICPTPEDLLLEYVKKNNCEKIRRLVKDNQNLLSYVYKEPHKPILLIACTEDSVQPKTVQTLIDEGADLYYSSSEDEDWQALHFAASETNSDKLKIIVDNLQPGKINELAKGSNALHVLLTYGDSDKEEEFPRCAQILIEAGIDLNQGDANNISPILWAAKKGFKDIIAAILDNGVTAVDIDTHTSRGKTARVLINEKCLYDKKLPDPSKLDNNNNDPVKILFTYLKQSKENAFVNYNQGKIQEFANAESLQFNSTLLQLCCQEGLYKAAKHLLNNGADPNKTASRNSTTPIEIAANYGFFEIFELLLENPQVQIPCKVLSYLTTKQNQSQAYSLKNEEGNTYIIDHKKCYEALMKKLKQNKALIDVNEQDERSNTPLHYAIRYADPERAHELLGLGASLACKNMFGIMPVEDIEPNELERHLDNCIEFDVDSKKLDKEDFTVTFNYRTLLPPQKLALKNCISSESSDAECSMSSVSQELTQEMEVISYMSKAVEFKHLLKHPVIVSFLFMKWYRIAWLFYLNLLFYMIFVLSLVTYIFASYGNINEEGRSGFASALMYMSYGILWITYIILAFRELFQVIACWEKYFKNFENYIEVILIVITGCILTYSPPSDNARRQLSALAILLAAFELVLMVGQHPLLSTNVVMLKTVSYNFFKFLLWYSLLIIAFSMSFYLLFTDPPDKDDNQIGATTGQADPQQNEGEKDEEENLFENPGKSIFKTIVMLTGEFDASDLNFHTYPIISKIIFIMFVFMIAIILLNLLTGLAVSDTQMIKNDAELVGHIARAQHIKYVETMLLGNILPQSAIRTLRNLCCCIEINHEIKYVFTPLARRACIFPDLLNYELTMYPNKQGQVEMNNLANRRKSSAKSSCWNCSNIRLDRETVKRTNLIIHAKRERQNEDIIKQSQVEKELYIKKLEKKIEEIQQEQSNINEKLDIIINCIYDKSM